MLLSIEIGGEIGELNIKLKNISLFYFDYYIELFFWEYWNTCAAFGRYNSSKTFFFMMVASFLIIMNVILKCSYN